MAKTWLGKIWALFKNKKTEDMPLLTHPHIEATVLHALDFQGSLCMLTLCRP